MKKSNLEHAESYLERAKAFGLVTPRNEAAFLAVAEMMKHPLSVEQTREQIRRGNPDAVRYRDPAKIWMPNASRRGLKK